MENEIINSVDISDSANNNKTEDKILIQIKDSNRYQKILDRLGLNEEQFYKALDTLNCREKAVLELRLGLKDGKARTLEEAGSYYNVSPERIRQIEAKALHKLLHPRYGTRLRDFI